MTIGEFKKDVAVYRREHPQMRYGQAVFNCMHYVYPERADKYRCTPLDPFYKDEMAEAFISVCLEE